MKNIKDKTKEETPPLAGKMICPQCHLLGKKSTITYHSETEVIPQTAFWDEDGELHNHSASFDSLYHCSNDHELVYRIINPLPLNAYCQACNPDERPVSLINFFFQQAEDAAEEWRTPKTPEPKEKAPTFYLEYVGDVEIVDENQNDG